MSNRKVLVFLLIPLTIFLAYKVFLYWAHDFSPDYDSVDRCLDGGGCWDYQDKICRKNEMNSQELCDRTNPYK